MGPSGSRDCDFEVLEYERRYLEEIKDGPEAARHRLRPTASNTKRSDGAGRWYGLVLRTFIYAPSTPQHATFQRSETRRHPPQSKTGNRWNSRPFALAKGPCKRVEELLMYSSSLSRKGNGPK